MAEPIAVLMDGLARFSGSVVEAPERIRTGDSVLLSLRAYLSSSAFLKPNLNTLDDKIQVLNEGSETATEKSLRERRSSILRLFELIGLKPRVAAPVVDLHPVKSADDNLNNQKDRTSKEKKSLKKEVIGEGEDAEEVEVDDDEEVLQEADIDMIYKKYVFYLSLQCVLNSFKRAQKHDQDMEELEPADSFAMTLRPYQKQALGYTPFINLSPC